MEETPKRADFLPDLIRLADYVIDIKREELRKESGEHCELRPQAFAVLKYMALHAGRLVTKQELLAEVWRGTLVTDDSLVQAIGDIRRVMHDKQHQVIKTIPRRGYMLIEPAITFSELAVATPVVARIAEAPMPVEPKTTEPSLASERNALGMTSTTVAALSSTAERQEHPAPVARRQLSRKAAMLLAGSVALVLIVVGAWVTWHNDPAATLKAGTFPSIAVLPFKGEPGQLGNEDLAREIAADLASELARSPELHVISTQSSFRFSAAQMAPPDIGRRLHSRYLIDGSVRRDRDQLRLTVQLLDSQDGQVMWLSTHAVDRTTLDAVQQEFVSRIAGTLQSKLTHFEERRAVIQPPRSLDVVVLCARAKSAMLRYSADGVRESRHLLEQALSIDPDYAPSWALLAVTNTIDYGLHLTGEVSRDRAPEVLYQARRAVALRPDMPKAYAGLSDAEGMFGNFDAALAAAKECLRLSPNDALCFYVLGTAQMRLGQLDPAIRSFEQALDRNPLPHAALTAFYATTLWARGRLDDALRMAEDCLARAPDFWRCSQDRIVTLFEMGRHAEAQEEGARLRAQHPEMTSLQFKLLWAPAAAVLGERRSALARAMGFP